MKVVTKVIFSAESVTSHAAVPAPVNCAVGGSRILKSCLKQQGVTPRSPKRVSLDKATFSAGNRNTIYRTPHPRRVDRSLFKSRSWKEQCLQSYGSARVVAIQLADGLGLVDDPRDRHYWDGASISVNEDRRLPMIWLGDSVLKYTAPDREEAWYSLPYPILPARAMSRRVALGLSSLGDFHHLGDVPRQGEVGIRIEEVPLRECEAKVISEVSAPSRISRSAMAKNVKAKRSNTKFWLVDSGCGHDLLSKKEVADAGLDQIPCENPVRFNTAGGPTTATTVSPVFIDELRGNVRPYVLPSTPSVVSMGRRCGHEGYSFVWSSGKCPYFVTPDGQMLRLRVQGDIPYIVPGDPFCQPIALGSLTEEERASMPVVADLEGTSAPKETPMVPSGQQDLPALPHAQHAPWQCNAPQTLRLHPHGRPHEPF